MKYNRYGKDDCYIESHRDWAQVCVQKVFSGYPWTLVEKYGDSTTSSPRSGGPTISSSRKREEEGVDSTDIECFSFTSKIFVLRTWLLSLHPTPGLSSSLVYVDLPSSYSRSSTHEGKCDR